MKSKQNCCFNELKHVYYIYSHEENENKRRHYFVRGFDCLHFEKKIEQKVKPRIMFIFII